MFSFLTETAITPETIIIPLLIGIIIACIVLLISKQVAGKFVTRLIKRGATDEGTALYLSEIGLDRKALLKFSLKHGSSLKKVICSVAPEGGEKATDRKYYIPREKEEKAKYLYGRNGAPVLFVILALCVLTGVVILVLKFLPELETMLGNLTDKIKETVKNV